MSSLPVASALSSLASLVSLPFEQDHYTYHLEVGDQAFRIHDFQATEALSTPFEYSLRFSTDAGPSLRDLLGHDAKFFIEHGGRRVRTVFGFVSAVRPLGTEASRNGRTSVVRLAPHLLQLHYSGGRRFHRNETLRETVEKLLGTVGAKIKWSAGDLPKREIRHQLDESDLEFLTRILAKEGVHYYFLHGEKASEVVFVNAPGGYAPMGDENKLRYRETGGAVTDEHVRTLAFEELVRTELVSARAYVVKKPRLPMDAEKKIEKVTGKASPARARYRWDVSAYQQAQPEGEGFAKSWLERLRADAVRVDGASTCYRLQVGSVFELDGHDDAHLNVKYVVTELELEGADPKSVLGGMGASEQEREPPVHFRATFADVPLRPVYEAPSTPPMLARITGPRDGEAHVDELGRVKIQLLWDKEHTWTDDSSCWVRVHMPFAGQRHGIYYPPRAGMECVVQFVDGDPDEPYVAAFLYNGLNGPPQALPDGSRKYTMMTASSPGGAGWNELTFDTTAGQEQVFLKAQRDLVEVVGNNHAETTTANHATSVGANQALSVGGNRAKNVTGNEAVDVRGHRNETVHETETVSIGKGRTHTVKQGADALTVGAGDRTVTVKGNQTSTVQHRAKLDAEDIEENATKTFVVTANNKVELKQQAMTMTFEGQAMTVSSPQWISMGAPSGSVILKDDKVTVEAKSELTLKCGSASITLKKDGTVKVTGAMAVELACQGSTVKLEPAKAALQGPEAHLSATGVAQVMGALIKIG